MNRSFVIVLSLPTTIYTILVKQVAGRNVKGISSVYPSDLIVLQVLNTEHFDLRTSYSVPSRCLFKCWSHTWTGLVYPSSLDICVTVEGVNPGGHGHRGGGVIYTGGERSVQGNTTHG